MRFGYLEEKRRPPDGIRSTDGFATVDPDGGKERGRYRVWPMAQRRSFVKLDAAAPMRWRPRPAPSGVSPTNMTPRRDGEKLPALATASLGAPNRNA
jgi:hypothetical protein